jgi:hypothetical protein
MKTDNFVLAIAIISIVFIVVSILYMVLDLILSKRKK